MSDEDQKPDKEDDSTDLLEKLPDPPPPSKIEESASDGKGEAGGDAASEEGSES